MSEIGGVTSVITIFWVCVEAFPFASVYVQVTTVVPCIEIGSVASFVTETNPAQLSVAVGSVNVVTPHSAVTSANVAISGIGASVSITVTVCVHWLAFPLASVIVQITFVTPNE